jgi:hypothetical protein
MTDQCQHTQLSSAECNMPWGSDDCCTLCYIVYWMVVLRSILARPTQQPGSGQCMPCTDSVVICMPVPHTVGHYEMLTCSRARP